MGPHILRNKSQQTSVSGTKAHTDVFSWNAFAACPCLFPLTLLVYGPSPANTFAYSEMHHSKALLSLQLKHENFLKALLMFPIKHMKFRLNHQLSATTGGSKKMDTITFVQKAKTNHDHHMKRE